MDNLKSPAFPYSVPETDPGFTKLELASLMMAQGIASNAKSIHYKSTASSAVLLAKAVIEEANLEEHSKSVEMKLIRELAALSPDGNPSSLIRKAQFILTSK